MKNYIYTFAFLFLTIGAVAQTENNKLGITTGFGFQQYNGDLGNGFYSFKTSTYGVTSLNLSYYLSKTFDVGIMGTLGDFGYCQTKEEKLKYVSMEDRCNGCVARTGKGNLNSRMVSGGIFIKYKLANGNFFREEVKLKPYLYIGTSINHITDNMKMNCINAGNYVSLNAGVGFRYDINERFSLGYNIGFGSFTSDKVDFMDHGRKDQYLQNSLFLGVNLF